MLAARRWSKVAAVPFAVVLLVIPALALLYMLAQRGVLEEDQ